MTDQPPTFSFVSELLQSGEEILTDILNHPIILSLADINPFPEAVTKLSQAELIQARNNFFIEDYFYLVYGYRVTKAFLLDTTPHDWLVDQLGENRDSLLAENKNPLFSASVRTLRQGIEEFGLSIAGQTPNLVTQEYIIFKTQAAFQGDAEGLTASLSCLWVYYQIGSKLNQQRGQSRYFQDLDFARWLQVLTDAANPYYLKKTRSIIERLVTDISSDRIPNLRKTFLEACSLEYRFIDALISS